MGVSYDERMKWAFATITGLLAQFFNQYGIIIMLVCAAVVFDTITGMIKSKILGEAITSKKGTRGFWKKLALLTGLFFGIFLDAVIPLMLQLGLNVTLPYQTPFGIVVGMYIILNESISVIENFYQAGVSWIPEPIVNLLKLSKQSMDNSNEPKE